jgi:hypothetical protein
LKYITAASVVSSSVAAWECATRQRLTSGPVAFSLISTVTLCSFSAATLLLTLQDIYGNNEKQKKK